MFLCLCFSGVAHEETNKSEKSDSFMTDNSAQVQVPFMSQPGILAGKSPSF